MARPPPTLTALPHRTPPHTKSQLGWQAAPPILVAWSRSDLPVFEPKIELN